MRGAKTEGRARLWTILGISVAVGVLLVSAMLLAATSAATSTIRLERPAVLKASDTTCGTGESPVLPGFDPITHEIYVPNEGGNISVYNETCHLVGTISLASGAEPWQAAFDPQDDYMYVTDYGLDVVYAISGLKIVSTITGFDAPVGITYDPGSTLVDVVNSGSDSVSTIYATANLGRLFYTGSDPYEIAYDYSCGCDLVTNTESDNVTIYVTYTHDWFSVTVGKSPEGIAYDFASGLDYVANTGSNSVMAILGESGSIEETITGFHQPDAVAWDQADLDVYVTNVGNGKVYLISGDSILKKESTASDSAVSGLAFDDFDDSMYATGYDTDVLYVLS